MSRLLIAGKHEGDRVVAAFQDAAQAKDWEVKGIELEKASMELAVGDWGLVCFVPGGNQVRPILEMVKRASGAKIVLYARKGRLGPDTAMEFCVEFKVPWVFSQVEEDDERRNDLELRVSRLLDSRCPATKIRLDSNRIRTDDNVFVISRFAPEFRNENESAIRSAIGRLGLVAEYGDAELTSEFLHDKVCRQIDACSIVLADVTQSKMRKYEKNNPNVFYEIGWARSKGKPVILMRDERQGSGALPADIHGLQFMPYWGPVDLGHKLYFGLKQGPDESDS